ncbi:hypothetical protein FRC20_006401 [Serendipita sp. 405]|nr:hypothetical protein FRC15_009422 [Serendipita sp. 397]KAG8804602.1 hypothetical protein FRC16_006044 [Serendipita sp. 398]KAG8878724.1 hypothetical protein FRC20_006401 [Serendipita sp. 405]
MTISINTTRKEQTIKLCFINGLFMGGLILDLVASFLAFLTARWLQRLSAEERSKLEEIFTDKSSPRKNDEEQPAIDEQELQKQQQQQQQEDLFDRILHFWLSFSLFSSMPLLVLGVMCMAAGIGIYVLTCHKPIVGVLVILAYVGLAPIVVGIFLIGSGKKRRMGVIHELGKRRGDW